jgi:hypothetical protein
LRHFILTLIRSQNPPSIIDVSRALSTRLLDELDGTQLALQRTEKALAGEYESGRALRLLLKLGFVNERPENGVNRRWSQSGDCYVLTLFRDYGKVFISGWMVGSLVEYCNINTNRIQFLHLQSFTKPMVQEILSWTWVMS